MSLAKLRIPAKANSIPEGSRTGFRAGPEQQSERSDAGFLIVQEVFGLVKERDVPEEVRSEAEAGDSELGKGCGERDSSPVPRSVLERPDGVSPAAYAPPRRFLRIESPFISMRWALWTRRSRIPSATVGSPTCSCQRATGSCEVRIMDRVW